MKFFILAMERTFYSQKKRDWVQNEIKIFTANLYNVRVHKHIHIRNGMDTSITSKSSLEQPKIIGIMMTIKFFYFILTIKMQPNLELELIFIYRLVLFNSFLLFLPIVLHSMKQPSTQLASTRIMDTRKLDHRHHYH